MPGHLVRAGGVRTVLQKLGIDQADVVGHDIATMVAYACARYRCWKSVRVCRRSMHRAQWPPEVPLPALVEFLVNNLTTLPNCHRERRAGRRISTAAAASVMDRLINRRLSKRQQMRWSMGAAHDVLLARVEMLDRRLVEHFVHRFLRFLLPRIPLQSQLS